MMIGVEWRRIRTAALLEAAPAVPALTAWVLIVAWAVTWRYDDEHEYLIWAGIFIGSFHVFRGIGWFGLSRYRAAGVVFGLQFVLMFGWLYAALDWIAATDADESGRVEMLWIWFFAIAIIVSPLVSAGALLVDGARGSFSDGNGTAVAPPQDSSPRSE